MKVLLDIKDNKAAFVMELLSNLSHYVKAKPLTEAKALLLEEINEAVDEMKLIKEGKKKRETQTIF